MPTVPIETFVSHGGKVTWRYRTNFTAADRFAYDSASWRTPEAKKDADGNPVLDDEKNPVYTAKVDRLAMGLWILQQFVKAMVVDGVEKAFTLDVLDELPGDDDGATALVIKIHGDVVMPAVRKASELGKV